MSIEVFNCIYMVHKFYEKKFPCPETWKIKTAQAHFIFVNS